MTDKDNRETKTDERRSTEAPLGSGVGLVPANKQELTSQAQHDKSTHKKHANRAVTLLILLNAAVVIALCLRQSRTLLDNHNGLVSAIAAVEIAILTIAYVVYAKNQWQVMSGQLEQMKEQLPELQKSSKAALLNAQYVFNAERPWMLIEIKTSDSPPGIVPDNMWFSVSFKNFGKTPAEVIGLDQRPECRVSCDDLPPNSEYSDEGAAWSHTRIVPPGEVWRHPGESSFAPNSFLVGDQWKDIRNSGKRFVYWGRLRYRNLIENPKTIHELEKVDTIHETCFCYFWSPRLNEFLICGPLGYNKHT